MSQSTASTSAGESSGKAHLARTLGLWAVVALGLGYMGPTVALDTFGIVADETRGVVPTAYIMALVVMLFTAISYGRMTRVFPSAGSAYTYASETISPNLGFLIGWSALLDYLLLPLVNALVIRSYLHAFFPDAPDWIFVVVYVAFVTALVLVSMTNTSRVNMILVVFNITLIVVFIVLAVKGLIDGMGAGTIISTEALWHANTDLAAVITGSTIVAFSFIGFDAITMYTEEAKDPSIVPKAIVLTLLIGGFIFFVSVWFAQLLFPDASAMTEESLQNSALPELAFQVGGQLFKILLTAGAFAAALASSLASHASVARLLYVMGRNGRGPFSRFLGYVHPRFHTPSNTVILVGVVSLFAIFFNLNFIAALINFGALIAFTFVNLTVIVYFAIRGREVRGAGEIFRNIVLPAIGVVLTAVLWWHLSPESTLYGTIWLAIGIIALLWITRMLQRPMTLSLEEEQAQHPDAQVRP